VRKDILNKAGEYRLELLESSGLGHSEVEKCGKMTEVQGVSGMTVRGEAIKLETNVRRAVEG
jgi:hypothetical protein